MVRRAFTSDISAAPKPRRAFHSGSRSGPSDLGIDWRRCLPGRGRTLWHGRDVHVAAGATWSEDLEVAPTVGSSVGESLGTTSLGKCRHRHAEAVWRRGAMPSELRSNHLGEPSLRRRWDARAEIVARRYAKQLMRIDLAMMLGRDTV